MKLSQRLRVLAESIQQVRLSQSVLEKLKPWIGLSSGPIENLYAEAIKYQDVPIHVVLNAIEELKSSYYLGDPNLYPEETDDIKDLIRRLSSYC